MNNSKKILMFTMKRCPYCARARRWMEEALDENPAFRSIETEIVDELEQPVLADRYDYYFVPTYYVGGVKVHEGAATREIILSVYKKALNG